MQRHLSQSLRQLYHQRCCRRLYATPATAALQHRYTQTYKAENAAPFSRSQPSWNTEELSLETSEELPASNESEKRKGKRKVVDLGTERSRTGPSGVDVYLASLRAEGVEPTLDDLERLRPENRPRSTSPNYAIAYREVIGRLCRTFSKDQLRSFCEQLEFDAIWTRAGRRKVEYAESILEQEWEWDNLKEIERRKRDMTEVVSKSFSVSPSELFLLLGRDGSDLLQISVDFNVHISVTPNPLSIQIEGLRGSLKKLESLISERRKVIIEEIILLPTKAPLPLSLLQQISRLANAYMENVGYKGKIRICANDPRRLEGAKRLAMRAAVQLHHDANVPLLVHLPPDPLSVSPAVVAHTYALYPFLPTRSLPWTVKAGITFRSRKVGESFSGGELYSESLASGRGKLINDQGEIMGLSTIVTAAFQKTSNPLTITAFTGHILFSEKSRQQISSIAAPFPGHWQYPKFMTWLKEGKVNFSFVSSLPPPLHNALPSQEKIIHRLTYRKLPDIAPLPDGSLSTPVSFTPTQTITFEVILHQGTSSDAHLDTINDNLATLLIDSTGLSFPPELGDTSITPKIHNNASGLDEVNEDYMDVSSRSRGSRESLSSNSESLSLEFRGEPSCRKSKQLDILVALPDRPMDCMMKLREEVAGPPMHEFSLVNDYFSALRSYLDNHKKEHPEPPLIVADNSDSYILEASESVRRSSEYVDTGSEGLSGDQPRRSIRTVTESIVDLETNQRTVHCKLSSDTSSEGISEFIENVDSLTTLNYNAARKFKRASAMDDDVKDDAFAKLEAGR